MGEGLGTAGEAHAFAEVVASRLAVIAVFAHDACLDCNALTWYEMFYSRTNRDDHTCRLVAEDERGLDGKVTISPFEVVMN